MKNMTKQQYKQFQTIDLAIRLIGLLMFGAFFIQSLTQAFGG